MFAGCRLLLVAEASNVLCDQISGRLARQIVRDTNDDHLRSL